MSSFLSHVAAPTPRWVTALVAVLVAVFVGVSLTLYERTGDKRAALIVENRVALCQSIDADHNRERARIITNERLLYRVPEFHALIPTPSSEREAYNNARRNYNGVRNSRPDFCADLVPNPVKPFPPLSEFRSSGS